MAALVSAGVAAKVYTTTQSNSSSSSTTERRRNIADIQADERYDAERRRQNALMDEYGARDSLEELEKAVRFYEKRS